jgi:hypothetical protein
MKPRVLVELIRCANQDDAGRRGKVLLITTNRLM